MRFSDFLRFDHQCLVSRPILIFLLLHPTSNHLFQITVFDSRGGIEAQSMSHYSQARFFTQKMRKELLKFYSWMFRENWLLFNLVSPNATNLPCINENNYLARKWTVFFSPWYGNTRKSYLYMHTWDWGVVLIIISFLHFSRVRLCIHLHLFRLHTCNVCKSNQLQMLIHRQVDETWIPINSFHKAFPISLSSTNDIAALCARECRGTSLLLLWLFCLI